MRRYLDEIESLALSISPSYSIEYEGQMDSSALGAAFEILCLRYPVLRSRIVKDERGYLLDVSPSHHPRLIVRDGDERTLREEISRSWDPACEVSRLTLVRSNNRGHVALRMDHAVADGGSKMAMFHELWRIYTDIVNGLDILRKPGWLLPQPPSKLLEERWSGSRRKSSIEPTEQLETFAPCPAIKRVIRFTEEETARLVSTARSSGISVHALISGAITAAQRAQEKSITESARMLFIAPVNMRSRVVPAVGATDTTIFVAQHVGELIVPLRSDPIELGWEIKEQFDASISNRSLTSTIDVLRLLSSRVETPLEQHLAKVSVSNYGVLSPFAHPGDLKIIDFDTPLVNLAWQMYPTFGAYTYEGKLRIPCLCASSLFSEQDVSDLVDETTGQLRQLL